MPHIMKRPEHPWATIGHACPNSLHAPINNPSNAPPRRHRKPHIVEFPKSLAKPFRQPDPSPRAVFFVCHPSARLVTKRQSMPQTRVMVARLCCIPHGTQRRAYAAEHVRERCGDIRARRDAGQKGVCRRDWSVSERRGLQGSHRRHGDVLAAHGPARRPAQHISTAARDRRPSPALPAYRIQTAASDRQGGQTPRACRRGACMPARVHGMHVRVRPHRHRRRHRYQRRRHNGQHRER